MMSKHRLLLPCATAFLLLIRPSTSVSAFVNHPQRSARLSHPPHSYRGILPRDILHIRGGDLPNESIMSSPTTTSTTALSSAVGPIASSLRDALVSGSPLRGVGALFAVASLTVVPLTWYRFAYSFSVGYGLSIAAMAWALLAAFPLGGEGTFLSKLTASPPSVLAMVALVYGMRLGGFILLREKTVASKGKQFKELNKQAPLKRTPLALGVSLLYAFMMSPALFALRKPMPVGSLSETAQKIFTAVAACGTLLESIADQHKYVVKRGIKEGEDKFVGPTTWSYRLCRHPNYLGEIMQWIGLFGAGSVAFGKSLVAWVCGGLGLWGIVAIMLMSTSSLEKKQSEKYGGQPRYDKWTGTVKSTLVPFLK